MLIRSRLNSATFAVIVVWFTVLTPAFAQTRFAPAAMQLEISCANLTVPMEQTVAPEQGVFTIRNRSGESLRILPLELAERLFRQRRSPAGLASYDLSQIIRASPDGSLIDELPYDPVTGVINGTQEISLPPGPSEFRLLVKPLACNGDFTGPVRGRTSERRHCGLAKSRLALLGICEDIRKRVSATPSRVRRHPRRFNCFVAYSACTVRRAGEPVVTTTTSTTTLSSTVPTTSSTSTSMTTYSTSTSTSLPPERYELTVRVGSPPIRIVEAGGTLLRYALAFVFAVRHPATQSDFFPPGTRAEIQLNNELPFEIADANDLLVEGHSFTPGNRGTYLDILVRIYRPGYPTLQLGPQRYLLVDVPVTTTTVVTTSSTTSPSTTSTTLPAYGRLRLFRPDWTEVFPDTAVFTSATCRIWTKVYLNDGYLPKGGTPGKLYLYDSSGNLFHGYPATVPYGSDFVVSGQSFHLGYPPPYVTVAVEFTLSTDQVVRLERLLFLKTTGSCYN